MTTEEIADRYRSFAAHETAGFSPTLTEWALGVAGDPALLHQIAQLPPAKQQPNLVFAAARLSGATPGNVASLLTVLTEQWPTVRDTILRRSTQTNEAARCAAVCLGLAQVRGPIALVEVGAAAGLCLIPDRYSYRFTDATQGAVLTRLDPPEGPSSVEIGVAVDGGLVPPQRMPQIVWRVGLDLHPLDAADPADREWLQTLVWPEQEERRRRLMAAAALTARSDVDVRRGDLLRDLAPLVAEAPQGATLVVSHSATLAYLDDEQRRRAVELVEGLGARRFSFEARGVDPTVPEIALPVTPQTLFVAALDGMPLALCPGHGDVLTAAG